MKTTLFKILWLKEIKYWKRSAEMFNKFNSIWSRWTLGVLVMLLVTVFHYSFALMHLLFETFLFIFARKQFKNNLQQMILRI